MLDFSPNEDPVVGTFLGTTPLAPLGYDDSAGIPRRFTNGFS